MIDPPDFDRLYAGDDDPWRVGSSFYEQRKRSLLLAALGRPRYRWAWDTACGTGHLAAALAARCDRVTASDGSDRAVALTRWACARAGVGDRVEAAAARLPYVWPTLVRDGRTPDLIVIAEWLYYLDEPERSTTVDVIAELAPGSGSEIATASTAPPADVELVAVHWRHHPHDAYLSGAEVNRELHVALTGRGWTPGIRVDDPHFVLDSWHRTGAGPAPGDPS